MLSMFLRRTAAQPRFLHDGAEPAYLALYRSGELQARAAAALGELADCCACPRNCHVNRLDNESRVCHTGRFARVASAFAHFGEEGCLRGRHGSGTLFFALCNLRCVFCQNWDISQQAAGGECDADRLADLMLDLQARGCHNINFVTPEHVVPQLIEAIAAAVPRGLRLPIVYNTSAYDSVASLKLLDGVVDIYMPDFKFWTYESARRYLKAKDYPRRAREAIAEMHRQVGVLKLDPGGMARRGVLVRHLIMPGRTEEVAAISRWLAEALSPDTYVNLMAQYRPRFAVGLPGRDGKPQYPDIDRRPSERDLQQALAAAKAAGLWRFDGCGIR